MGTDPINIFKMVQNGSGINFSNCKQNVVQSLQDPSSGNYKLAFKRQRSQIITEYSRLLNTNSIWKFTAKLSPSYWLKHLVIKLQVARSNPILVHLFYPCEILTTTE
jgi:hypothetical protein